MINFFPEEIKVEILFRLPIKSLIICTSVCKSWKSIIKNSSFIHAHLSHRISTSHQHGNRFLLHGLRYKTPYIPLDKPTEEVYCLHYDNEAFEEYCKIDFQLDRIMKQSDRFIVAGSCNGLVCLVDDLLCIAFNYILWNPVLRKAVLLPNPAVTFPNHGPAEDSIGLGFDAMTNDYKVVRLFTVENLINGDENTTVAEVCSLSMCSWRSLGSVVPPCQLYGRRQHVFLNGAIHWAVSHWKNNCAHDYFILTFDLASESFGKIMMPKGTELHFESQVSVSGDGKSLALFTRYDDENDDIVNLDIWLMTEYSVHESWTKLMTLRPQGPGESLPPRALCFRKSGQLFLLPRELYFHRVKLASLDIRSQQLSKIGIFDYVYCFIFPYEESLVLLDMEDAVSC